MKQQTDWPKALAYFQLRQDTKKPVLRLS